MLDLIERVSNLTGIAEPIIVGSQSLFAITKDVPSIIRDSIECDFLLAPSDIQAMQIVNEELGILSSFARESGYYADGLGLATVVLVQGWKDRLQPLKDENGKTVAQCLEPHDAAVSKLMAGREKDFEFITALLDSQLISLETLIERAALIQETASSGALLPRLNKLHEHLRKHISHKEPEPLLKLIAQLKTQD